MLVMPDLNEFQKSGIVGMKQSATTPATIKRSIHRVQIPVTLFEKSKSFKVLYEPMF